MDNALPIILALESSAGRASVALARGDEILAEEAVEAAHGHAAWIIPLAQRALATADFSFADIGAIVAGRGPGSFTGIRVALAAAKGLGLSLGRTAVGRSSLAAMAHHDSNGDGPIISMIDSRRKSIYFQIFNHDNSALCPATDGQIDDIMAVVSHIGIAGTPITINGHHAADIAERLHQDGIGAEVGKALFPSAADLCRLYAANPTINEGLEPLYLAPPLISKAASR